MLDDKQIYSVQKLLSIFRIDGTVEEACAYAGIPRSTYYDRISKKKKLLDKNTGIEILLEDAVKNEQELFLATAKKTVYNAINKGDVKVALEVLSRRDPKYKTQAKGTVDDPIHTKDTIIQYHIPNNNRDDKDDLGT